MPLNGPAIEASGATGHIPGQSNVRVVRTVGRAFLRERNGVYRFFNRLNHFTAILAPYHKAAANFLAVIHLAAARLGTRH